MKILENKDILDIKERLIEKKKKVNGNYFAKIIFENKNKAKIWKFATRVDFFTPIPFFHELLGIKKGKKFSMETKKIKVVDEVLQKYEHNAFGFSESEKLLISMRNWANSICCTVYRYTNNLIDYFDGYIKWDKTFLDTVGTLTERVNDLQFHVYLRGNNYWYIAVYEYKNNMVDKVYICCDWDVQYEYKFEYEKDLLKGVIKSHISI